MPEGVVGGRVGWMESPPRKSVREWLLWRTKWTQAGKKALGWGGLSTSQAGWTPWECPCMVAWGSWNEMGGVVHSGGLMGGCV